MPKPRSSSVSKSDQSESSKMCLSTLMLSNGRSFLVLHYYIIYYSTVPFGPWLKKLKPCCLSLPPMRVKIYLISLSAEMDVCPMQYASGYLELFSSYFRMEKRIIRLVDQYVFEQRKVLILVIAERVDGGRTSGGGKIPLDGSERIVWTECWSSFSGAHTHPSKEEVAKKVIQASSSFSHARKQ